MREESPFTLRRFEAENRHLYYLPKEVFSVLNGRRTIYLIGSRGTGKTTLLRAMHWEERLKNVELQEKLATGFAQDCIGIYMKMSSTMAGSFDAWPAQASTQLQAAIFCLYVDLIWLQSACEAVAAMILAESPQISARLEYDLTRGVTERFPELKSGIEVKQPLSIKGLGSALYQKRRQLERWAYSSFTRDADELTTAFPIGQIGDLGREVGAELSQFCVRAFQSSSEWHFKVCLDEAECFTAFQQRAINTAVRLTQAPISFAISYVRLVDVTSTFVRDISLQDADRAIIPLDEMTDAEFIDLAEGVATVRIQRRAPSAPHFSTGTTCGQMDINELLSGILASSASPEAKALLRAARELQSTPYFSETWERTGSAPPIYQAYIMERLRLMLPAPQSERWLRRKQHSAEIRKRMVAAYLCICKELKTQVKYAGAEMVFQMSDKCIRDYLSEMDLLYEAAGVPIERFGLQRISFEEQNRALVAAGNRKRETIPVSEVGSPVQTLRLIDSLGLLTAHLQTALKGMRALKSPERGLFVIVLEEEAHKRTDTIRLITEAADAGFLKLWHAEDQKIRFRLHTSLAAAFGVSYRGAYYESIVKQGDVIPLYSEANSDVRAANATALGDLLLGSEATLPLFDGAE
jgi:hypothetical protein